MLKITQFKKNHPNQITINFMDKYKHKYHQKNATKLQKPREYFLLKHNQLITPKRRWFMLVHLTIGK